jgi:O-antigen/teichoic acid export membrane protein
MALSAKWSPAVVPTQVLAVAGMVGCLTDANNQLLLAAGKAASLMKGIFVLCIAYGAFVFAGTAAGVIGAAAGATFVYVAWLLLTYRFQVGPTLNSSTWSLLTDAAPGFTAAAALVAVGGPLGGLLHHVGLPAFVVFVITAAAGTATYAGVVRGLFPEMASELFVVAKTLARRDRNAANAQEGHAAIAPPVDGSTRAAPQRETDNTSGTDR